MKIISMFNHKGGVSKTTTTFNLGWALADEGYKVLIVDADPQCNLTSLVAGYDDIEDIDAIYTDDHDNIYSGVLEVFQGDLSKFGPISIERTMHENLFLMCGSIDLSEAERQISVAITTSRAIPALKNIPGSISALIQTTAKKNNIDFVLIDMSPSIGALNQCLLMGSDYFLVPTAPDFFCAQAIFSLSRVLPGWSIEAEEFRESKLAFPLPSQPPKFIGFISQKYRPRNSAPARAFQYWIDRINELVSSTLVPKLSEVGMSISVKAYEDGVYGRTSSQEEFNLSNIADFNSLIAKSQEHAVPVFALSDEQISQTGVVLKKAIENRDDFKKTFTNLAKSIVAIDEKTSNLGKLRKQKSRN